MLSRWATSWGCGTCLRVACARLLTNRVRIAGQLIDAMVVLAARSKEKLAAFAEELRAKALEALALPTYVREQAQVDYLIESTYERYRFPVLRSLRLRPIPLAPRVASLCIVYSLLGGIA